tara:strand:+ start:114 stop:326 length:213 start_codon:yes stop_codon:yes gene_type:complete
MKVIMETIEPNKMVRGKTIKPIIFPSRGKIHIVKGSSPIIWNRCLSAKIYRKLLFPSTLKGYSLGEKIMA